MFKFKARIDSFRYAIDGLIDLFRHHINAQIHLCILLLVCLFGFFFELKTIEWAVLLLCFAVVIACEALNSAIEYLCDLVSPEYNTYVKKAKDIAAGAVLWATLMSIILGLVIFSPYVVQFVKKL